MLNTMGVIFLHTEQDHPVLVYFCLVRCLESRFEKLPCRDNCLGIGVGELEGKLIDGVRWIGWSYRTSSKRMFHR